MIDQRLGGGGYLCDAVSGLFDAQSVEASAADLNAE
jgi:hypothetical protein